MTPWLHAIAAALRRILRQATIMGILYRMAAVPVTAGPWDRQPRTVRGRRGGRDVLAVDAHLVRDLSRHLHVAAALKPCACMSKSDLILPVDTFFSRYLLYTGSRLPWLAV